MGQVEIIIRNEKGEIINQKTALSYPLDLGDGSLDEIEAAVERLRHEISPLMEHDLFMEKQKEKTEEIKKKKK